MVSVMTSAILKFVTTLQLAVLLFVRQKCIVWCVVRRCPAHIVMIGTRRDDQRMMDPSVRGIVR